MEKESAPKMCQDTLSISHLSKLHTKYSKYESKWFGFGVKLGISVDRLEAIKTDNHKCHDCFREMIMFWLRNGSRKESDLKQVAKAIDQMNSTQNKKYYNLIAIVFVIIIAVIGVITKLYCPNTLQVAAETLRNDYRNHKVALFILS